MKRQALVVGVGQYDDTTIKPLRFAVGDAILVADRLACNGFRTCLLANPTRGRLNNALFECVADLSAEDLFLFFFVGQGFASWDGSHRLFCRDDRMDLLSQGHAGLPASTLFALDNDSGFQRVVLLDSAHSDGSIGGAQAVRGLDAIDLSGKAKGVASGKACLIRASDRYLPCIEIDELRHGLFAKAIADALDEEDKSLRTDMGALSRAITQRVAQLAAGNAAQITPVPAFFKVGDDFPLISDIDDSGPGQQGGTDGATTDFTVACPHCKQYCGVELKWVGMKVDCPSCGKKFTVPPPADSDSEANDNNRQKSGDVKPGERRSFRIAEGVDMDFRWCPSTTSLAWKELSGGADHFMMGSPLEESGRNPADEYQHGVRLTKGFWISETPVLQAQWEAVMGRTANHSPKKGGENPVTGIAWEDAKDFLAKVNDSGCPAQLPTEAQWEYACRAGTTGPFGVVIKGKQGYFARKVPVVFCIIIPVFGWIIGLIWRLRMFWRTRPVRQGSPNAWGIHDMHGNCGEWCSDWFGPYPAKEVENPTGPADGAEHVVRGMNRRRTEARCRSASRWHAAARKLHFWRNRHGLIGLRLVINQ